jgi:Ca2+-binding RTX toxin-like protein
LIGGHGNDTYFVDSFFDVVIESGGQGIDTVYASSNYALPAGADIEILRTISDDGTAPLRLTGNSSGNQIIGNNGDNVLDGGGGNDQLIGRGGNDFYIVDSNTDTIAEAGGQGIDTVLARASYTLTEGADVERIGAFDDIATRAIDLTGNSSGNQIVGNAENNVLNGGGGRDQLIGFAGQDSFLFDTALDATFNVDTIVDFNVADDTILLDQDIFSSSLGLGNISAGELVIGPAALDANDRIIYDSATGALSYDSDGVGATAAIQFATLSTGLGLTYLDFVVV